MIFDEIFVECHSQTRAFGDSHPAFHGLHFFDRHLVPQGGIFDAILEDECIAAREKPVQARGDGERACVTVIAEASADFFDALADVSGIGEAVAGQIDLIDVERAGVRINGPALAAQSQRLEQDIARRSAEIYEAAGGEFNIGSPIQLREVLFDRLKLSTKGIKKTKTGLSTDVDVLTKLAADHPLPAKILEYRQMAKMKSTYVDALPALIDPVTGRVHTSFNQTIAAHYDALETLQSVLALPSLPRRIECFDISTIQGSETVASMVVCEDGRMKRADYRKFRIRGLQRSLPTLPEPAASMALPRRARTFASSSRAMTRR